jgi:hypothetical protein
VGTSQHPSMHAQAKHSQAELSQTGKGFWEYGACRRCRQVEAPLRKGLRRIAHVLSPFLTQASVFVGGDIKRNNDECHCIGLCAVLVAAALPASKQIESEGSKQRHRQDGSHIDFPVQLCQRAETCGRGTDRRVLNAFCVIQNVRVASTLEKPEHQC